MVSPYIRLENASLNLGGRSIVKSVNFEIAERKIVSLIGPNGAGKTSLVRLLLGLLEPTTGTVERKKGLTIGYVPQRFPVDPSFPLSVLDFMRTAKGHRGRTASAGFLARLGAAHLMDRAVVSLSGGELQSVLVARALSLKPELLVLDEPAQGMDLNAQAEFYQLLSAVRSEMGCAIFLVSHDLHLVMASTDEVICLNRHICCHGQPAAVSRHPEYLKLFGTHQAAQFAVYRHVHDHAHGKGGEIVDGDQHDG